MLRLLIFPITAPFPDKLLSTPMFRRLSAQVDHLTKKPQNGERCLKEIQSILVENDISPFEVYVLTVMLATHLSTNQVYQSTIYQSMG